jgi:hypothetical protein
MGRVSWGGTQLPFEAELLDDHRKSIMTSKRSFMAPLVLSTCLLLFLCLGCFGPDDFHQPTLDQRLASGKQIKVTSCQLVWGAEHDERHPNQDSFALEYVSSFPPSAAKELDQEAVEVFELIRPISEQWGFSTASVAAFQSAERTGPYNRFEFSRSSTGHWSFRRQSAKVFNTASGRNE